MPLKRFKLSPEEVAKKVEQGILDDSNLDTLFESLEKAAELAKQPSVEEEKDTSERCKSA